MARNFRCRSSSVLSQQSDAGQPNENLPASLGAVMDSSSNNNISNNNKVMTQEDVDAAKRLLGSILYMQDPGGRSLLHTKFQLSWVKALLDRAKSLDECTEHDYLLVFHRTPGSSSISTNTTPTNNKPKTAVRSTLLQRRFLLQKDRESGYTPLHRAIVEGNLAAILLFLRHAMDTTSTGRLTQRPMQVLRSSENLHAAGDSTSNSSNLCSDNLLQMMATAVDKEGLTPLRLMGKLQRTELLKCRQALEACQPKVDQRATIRLRPRQNSFGGQDEGNEVDFFSENSDLLQCNDCDHVVADNKVSYACEVVTFGRPQHYALGVVQGISSSSTTKDNTQYSHANSFSTHRVQEFAQETVGRDGGAIAIAAATHHTLVVTKNGHLYACGLGKGGRLGLGDDQTQHCPLPKRVLGPLQRRCVVNVAAAENHSLCVTKDGTVFSWGSNRFGQLGDSAVTVLAGSRSVPRRVDDLKQHPCVAVAAGERHSVALSRNGEVYVWGDNACGQLGVPRRSGIQKVQRVEALWKSSAFPKIAIAVAAADQSTLVLTAASSAGLHNVNSIYEWGHGNHVPIKVYLDNTRTKESNGARDDANKRMELSSKAERVTNPVAIASGKYHNAAITSDGLVYTWGLHAESLGRNTNSSTKQQQRRNSSPQLVSGLFTEDGGGAAVAIAASDQRTAVVCDNGTLFTWGTTDGKDVLGHEGVRWQQLPRQVPGVHRAVSVAVAKEHTVLLIGASFPAIPKEEGVLSLDLVAARSAARHVDLFNVIPISIMAERTECDFLIEYCSNFVRRNLDGVLNAGKKSVMNQYVNDTLADTTHRVDKRYRDDHHHPYIFDVITAGNERRPSFHREWLSTLDEWTRSCNDLLHLPLVQSILSVADEREYEEDVACISSKARRSSSCYSDSEDRKGRSRSLSGGSEVANATSVTNQVGRLDACIKRTANMDLSTAQRANENTVWLSKEIRSVRKKLKQISHLLDTEAKSIVLTTEQKAKVERRPALEAELNVYESAMEEVKSRIKELHDEKAGCKVSLKMADRTHCKECSNIPIVSFSDEKDINFNNKADEPCGDNKEDGEAAKSDRLYFCDLCEVKCSDKSNLILHRNGRKHRNRVAQVVEEEKKVAAALILEKKQMEEIDNSSTTIPPRKNAWGVSSTPPKFKLPPPPHPVVPHVMPVSIKSSHWKTNNATTKELNGMAGVSSPFSAFEEILNKTKHGKKAVANASASSKVPPIWDSSPDSTRCVPLSLYIASERTVTGNRGSLSLSDFLSSTNRKPSPSGKSSPAPWLSPSSVKSPSSKSLMEIQAEEVNLKTREDKSSGIPGGHWYVERRERASPLLEIQKGARHEQEERLLVEEQFMIEAQILEENRRLQEEKERIKRRSQQRSKSNQRNKAKPKNTSICSNNGSSKPNSGHNERIRSGVPKR